jgi:hypothetical protein
LTEELKKRGIPFALEEERLTPEEEWEEEIANGMWAYLMETGETGEETIYSTLIFGESGAPNHCRCPLDLSR